MLNSDQLRAVQHISGPLMIIAGPGTGKTKTLVAKINYLIEEKIAAPDQILALTFTNKAAAEIRDRLANLASARPSGSPLVGTFHSFCLDLLSTYTQQSLQLISETDRKKMIMQLVKAEFQSTVLAEFSWQEIFLKLSQLKLSMVESNQLASIFEQQLARLLNLYNFQLATQQLIDFDDLLVKVVELLQTNQELAKKISCQYQAILIDEFQDTHPTQYQIINLITAQQTQPQLTVIGDPLQSIYSFRGAAGNIFQQFAHNYPDAQSITLTINYRSRPQIIELSHSLFPESPLLSAHDQQPAQVKIITTLNEQSESQWIVNSINQQLGGTDLNQASDYQQLDQAHHFSDFAIIFRTHHLARNLETALEKSGLPYQLVGGLSLFEKKEISFLIAACEHLIATDDLSTKKLRAFIFMTPNTINAISSLKNQVNQLSSTQLIDRLLEISKLVTSIGQSARKQQDLQTFRQYLNQFADQDWLAKSVAYFQHLQEHDYYDDRADRITLLTMHTAKGLEFEHVFLIGFENGLIPHHKRLSEEEVAEEKRLLYVALTRAKSNLTVLNCQERFHQDNRAISPFFRELDKTNFTSQLDPQIAKILKYRQKKIDQKRQLGLF